MKIKSATGGHTILVPPQLEDQPSRGTESNSPKLNNADIGLLARAVDGDDGHALDPVLDRVGHMGHDLHRPAKVVAAALLVDDIQVDLAGRDVVLAGEAD